MEEKLSFEQSLEQLEKIVKELETGSLNLDDAVKKYQAGIELANFCTTELKKAQNIVVKLMNQGELNDFDSKEE